MTKRPEEVKEWVAFAEEDLRSAEILLHEEIYNQACFHSQQCVEKMMKAALLMRGERLSRLHNLNELFEQCLQSDILSLVAFKKQIGTLSLYYTPTRYPDAVLGSLPDRLPNKKDAHEALEIAKKLFRTLQKVIS